MIKPVFSKCSLKSILLISVPIVYVFFKCTLGTGQINKVCDIYRLEAGKLAEHGDVIEHNVENIHSINNNSIF